MQLPIPTLCTPRLALVPIADAHLDAYASLYGDPVVMAHIGAPLDRAETWKLMARHAGHWVLRGYGGWTVQLRTTGSIVGLTGLQYPEGHTELEIGWVLKPESWGQGYAPEAAGAALAYAFDTVGAKRVVARIAPKNAGSIAVARKLGMRIAPDLSNETSSAYLSTLAGAAPELPAHGSR